MNENFIITKIDSVIFIKKEELSERDSVITSDLEHNELIFILSGKSTVFFNGLRFDSEGGTVRFLPKGKNKGYKVDTIEPGDGIDIFFDTDVPISEKAFELTYNKHEMIQNLFKKLFSVWVSKNDGYYFESVSILYKIFAELQKSKYISSSQYQAIEPAIKYIENHFCDKKITTEDLLSCVTISYSYLKKLFVEKFGISPKKYIIRMKINFAQDLLQTNRYSVLEVSEMCGYSDVYFFSRQFKEYTGVSPSSFLKKQNPTKTRKD